MNLVERHIIVNKQIDDLCFKSKNLYNYVNYLVRQEFISNGKMLNEYDISTQLAKENQIDFRSLPVQCSQQVIKLLFKNWKSFFKANKEYNKNKSKFKARPKLPNYKAKNGRNIVIFTNQNCKIKNGYIYFAKNCIQPIKTKVTQENLIQTRIIPQATCYVVEIVYEKEVQQVDVNTENYLSIDLGLSNLVTTFNNVGLKPFIINGKPLKSTNQYFNKRKAELMSFVKDKGTSNRIDKLTLKRNNKVTDYLHKTSRFIINYCIENKIGNIVIGNNKDWKQEVNLGKRNNQNFVSIPYEKLIQQIQYKAELVGIKVIITEESYTSKVDHLANEELCKHETYLGKRIKRGLFQSSIKKLINADVNGAIGILRKEFSNFDFNQITNRGLAFNPVKINLF